MLVRVATPCGPLRVDVMGRGGEHQSRGSAGSEGKRADGANWIDSHKTLVPRGLAGYRGMERKREGS